MDVKRAPTLMGRPAFQRTRTDLFFQDEISASKECASPRSSKEGTSISQMSGNYRKTPAKSRTPSPPNSGDEYDTDLEDDERSETPLDRWGVRTYLHTCKKLGLRPVGAVQRGLKGEGISVRGRGLNVVDSLAISNALMDNASVRSLALDENALGWKGAQYVSMLLFDNINITSLSVAGNDIGAKGTVVICEMLLYNETLTRLNLSGNNLTDNEAVFIAEVLKDTKYLTYFNLSHNDFGDEAGYAIGKSLAVNESLKVLDISWNKIRTKGCIDICNGLRVNVGLVSINLSYNGMGVAGAKAMSESLQDNEVLVDIDLTCNRIFDEGIVALGQALKSNETLKKLRVPNNPMTTASAMALLSVLKTNEYSALELLDMSSIHIYVEALKLVDEIKHIRPTFRFQYGGLINSDDKLANGDDDAFNNRNPLAILKDYIAAKNLRLVDMFKQFDKDGGGSLSRDEFINGLKSLEVPMTKAQLDRLIDMLDKDGDGEIDYAELVSGDREHRRKMRLQREAIKKLERRDRRHQFEKERADNNRERGGLIKEAAGKLMVGVKLLNRFGGKLS